MKSGLYCSSKVTILFKKPIKWSLYKKFNELRFLLIVDSSIVNVSKLYTLVYGDKDAKWTKDIPRLKTSFLYAWYEGKVYLYFKADIS